MSTNKRKEKRLKEELHAGRQAQEELARIQAINNSNHQALSKAMDDLVELQAKYNELELSWGRASGKAAALEGNNRTLERDNAQLQAANEKLREEVQKLQRELREARKENADLKSADKERSSSRPCSPRSTR